MCCLYRLYGICENAIKAKERRLARPVHVKAPVSKTDAETIELTLQGQRQRCGELEQGLKWDECWTAEDQHRSRSWIK